MNRCFFEGRFLDTEGEWSSSRQGMSKGLESMTMIVGSSRQGSKCAKLSSSCHRVGCSQQGCLAMPITETLKGNCKNTHYNLKDYSCKVTRTHTHTHKERERERETCTDMIVSTIPKDKPFHDQATYKRPAPMYRLEIVGLSKITSALSQILVCLYPPLMRFVRVMSREQMNKITFTVLRLFAGSSDSSPCAVCILHALLSHIRLC
jgi:hypothetical protein